MQYHYVSDKELYHFGTVDETLRHYMTFKKSK